LCGIGLFNAIVYTFAAVSTGGFAPHDLSLAGLHGWTPRMMVMSLCVAGSLSFVFYRQVYWKGLNIFASDIQTQAILVTCLLTSVGLGISMWLFDTKSVTEVLGHAPAIGLSAQTTAGFATLDIAKLSASSKLILIISMAVGGGVGSTAGGFKVLRLLIALRLISLLVIRTGTPSHALVTPRLGLDKLETDEIQQALCLIFLFVTLIVLSWLPFVAAKYDPVDSLFEVVSATATVGLSTGLTSAGLPTYLKGVLSVDMLMGRLEIIAWLVLIYPRTWLGQRREV
jgi:trk system potassium uptake protein TrkH